MSYFDCDTHNGIRLRNFSAMADWGTSRTQKAMARVISASMRQKRNMLARVARLVCAAVALCSAAFAGSAEMTADQVREALAKADPAAPIQLAGKDLSGLDLSRSTSSMRICRRPTCSLRRPSNFAWFDMPTRDR